MTYATVDEVQAGFRALSDAERATVETLLEEAAVIIDAYNEDAELERKKVVSCRMVRRSIGSGDGAVYPMGATQGSISAGGYSQSWSVSGGGSSGELYIGRTEKKLLGAGSRIGSRSPLEVI